MSEAAAGTELRGRTARRMLPWLVPYAGRIALALGCMVVLAATTAALGWLTGPVLRFLTGGQLEGAALVARLVPGLDPASLDRGRALLLVPVVLLVVGGLKGAAYFGQFHQMGLVAQLVVRDLRAAAFARVLSLSSEQLGRLRTGDLLARFGADLAGIELALTYAITGYLRDSLQVIALVATCFFIDARLSLIAFGAVPLAVLPLARLARSLRKTTARGQQSVGRLSEVVHQTVAGIRVVKAYGMESHLSSRFAAEGQRWLAAQRKGLAARAIAAPGMELLAVVGVAASLGHAVQRVGQGALLPAELLSFLATVALIFQPAKSLGKIGTFLLQGLAGAERILALLELAPAVREREGARALPAAPEELRFEDVRVVRDGRAILDGVTLSLRRGERVALVGASGAGKSTLASLLVRALDPDAGRVTIGGVDLRDATLASLRRTVALVPQEPLLFDDSVRDNVAYGVPADDARIRTSLQAAHVLHVVEALPQGLDTVVGERGASLSGGERQRLSLARALLRDAPVLVLDEVTSALDGESEREVLAGLDALLRGRTALIVAHRLSTVRDADRICVMAAGRIVEAGTHDELLRRGGEYRRLWELQGVAPGAAA